MGTDWVTREASLSDAANRMAESADLLECYSGDLMAQVCGSVRSPWGTGLVAMAMDEVNECITQTHASVSEKLRAAGDGFRGMTSNVSVANQAISAHIQIQFNHRSDSAIEA